MYGPAFTQVASKGRASGLIDQGVLFGDSITLLEVEAKTGNLYVEWWAAKDGDKKLFKAALYYDSLW